MARAAAAAASMSRQSDFCGETPAIDPSDARRSGAISCAPTTLTPNDSSARAKRAQRAVVALGETDEHARQEPQQRQDWA